MNAPAAPARDHRLQLGEVLDTLAAQARITAAQAQELKVRARSDARHPLIVIAECDWDDLAEPGRKLHLEALTLWLAGWAQLPYQRIDPLSLDVARITAVIPYAYAARSKLLPLKVTPTEVTIATAEPWLADWQRELAPALKREIVRVIANPADIERYLVEFYALARSVKASSEDRARNAPGGLQNLEQLMQLGRAGKLEANDQHTVAIVDWLLNFAFDQRASDIHLEPRRERGNIRFRIDGVLHEVYQTPPGVMTAVVSRLKILARMDVAEKRKPQDGRIKTRSPEGKEVELRASSLPTAFGEKLVLRIFDPEVLLKDFSELGFSPEDGAQWKRLVESPNGVVLVTGPTGSGKTTTLYSSLRHLATPDVNVCTIEDPIELVEPSFNQMQVHTAIDLTFAAGVRALLRQDPDIIMVGEVRDLETAENATQAALTGHLVLSTLHTNDAPGAITRLLELGVPAYLIKATLLGVLAQRLVRRLCPHCKRAVAPDAAAWRELAGHTPLPAQVHEPVGCLECRETGYLGRVGLYELMPMTAPLRALVDERGDLAALRAQAIKLGMVSLRQSGAQKVAAGLTSIAEALSAAPPDET